MKNSVKAIPLASINTAGLIATFLPINAGGLPAPCFNIRLINHSNIGIMISYDGITAHDYVLRGEVLTLPYQSEAGPHNDFAYLPQGTTIYASAPAAGIGLLYLAAYYQP